MWTSVTFVRLIDSAYTHSATCAHTHMHTHTENITHDCTMYTANYYFKAV